MNKTMLLLSLAVFDAAARSVTPAPPSSTKVTVDNFARAETDTYFSKTVADGGFGKLKHARQPTSIDEQNVVRMNRDTLYSFGVFDLAAGPVTVSLPDSGKRFVSLQAVSEDHYVVDVSYAPGTHTYTEAQAGTRYIYLIVRTLADAQDPKDIAAAHEVQDGIKVSQSAKGTFDVPAWDQASLGKARDALSALGALGGGGAKFGSKGQLDPIGHLIGVATGWGGNPADAATYLSIHPSKNDGRTVYQLKVRDVPVDGFWSISVYNGKGFFEKNDRNAYSVNNLTAIVSADGSYVIQFGGCTDGVPNCLPITDGWNYAVRLYRPRKEVLDGTWHFPEAEPK